MPKFRSANREDADNIAALHAKNWQLNYRGMLDDHYLDHQVIDDREKVWNERLSDPDPDLCIILAEEGPELIGFGCMFFDENEQYGSYLDNLHVAAEHSGKGIGKKLMSALATEIVRKGKRPDMYLWVLTGNLGAIKLYEKLKGQRKEQLWERELGNKAVEKIRYYWPDVSELILAEPK
ncbi:GNAT family N-acetyltransferase [Poritiphilus flavus]|uniref:GNAT family N-acetyltransferase n=1 Tax=Poritiphilus flavus TaxID=2697053 RepID=A0A6L9E7L3_9FLAO|nr:GNAT family N-acetyltransferase [Poritiphilus flavus]NAS10449.1 GNAT family N-acetyltransferase [Poritiphilus flavus]